MRSEWQNDDDSPSDRKMTRQSGLYAPNAIHDTHVRIPPGVNPDSLIVYAAIEGQD